MEKGFVDSLLDTVLSFEGATVLRSKDNFTLGIPDVLGWVPIQKMLGPTVWGTWRWDRAWAIAIEAKEVHPLMEDVDHRGRRTGQMLKHPFTGPQISFLRKLKASKVDAFGLVRVTSDTALRIEPELLPIKTGNFTYEEMIECCHYRVMRKKGRWRFWEKPDDPLPGAGY